MKLEGVRLLGLSPVLPGPYRTTVMAGHGAGVVKVEPPSGEPVRAIRPRAGGESVWFRNTHRGKKPVVLNLQAPADLATLRDPVRTCDVLVESFRSGVAARAVRRADGALPAREDRPWGRDRHGDIRRHPVRRGPRPVLSRGGATAVVARADDIPIGLPDEHLG
jgi:hypothetical protein